MLTAAQFLYPGFLSPLQIIRFFLKVLFSLLHAGPVYCVIIYRNNSSGFTSEGEPKIGASLKWRSLAIAICMNWGGVGGCWLTDSREVRHKVDLTGLSSCQLWMSSTNLKRTGGLCSLGLRLHEASDHCWHCDN